MFLYVPATVNCSFLFHWPLPFAKSDIPFSCLYPLFLTVHLGNVQLSNVFPFTAVVCLDLRPNHYCLKQ